MQFIQTVITQLSKSQVSNLVVVRSSQFISNCFVPTLLNTANTYISQMTTVLIVCFVFLSVFLFRINKQIRIHVQLFGGNVFIIILFIINPVSSIHKAVCML